MKVWLIVIQAEDTTWVHDAWDDNSTAENWDGWIAAVESAHETADGVKGQVRAIPVNIDGIYEAFETSELTGKIVEDEISG